MKTLSVQSMISLLEKKNTYLEEFQTLNQEEMQRISRSDFSNLESFYYDRELLLNAIDRIDRQLKHYSVDQCGDVDGSSKNQVLDLLKSKRKLIHGILAQDMKIHEQLNMLFSEKEKIAI